MCIFDYQMVVPEKAKRNAILWAESSEMPRHASPYRKVRGRTRHLKMLIVNDIAAFPFRLAVSGDAG
jgi:hypothetical protein